MISGPDQIAPSPGGLSEHLQREAEHFRALVEVTSDWLWEVDAQGRYTYASPRVKQLLGFEVSEVLGRSPFDFMAPHEAERVGADFTRLVSARQEFHEFINVNRHKRGHEVVLETSGVPIFDRDGTFRGFRGIDRDVTAREHALHRLRLADAAMQAAAEGMVVADAHGNITACNPAFAKLSGYSEEQLIGKPPSMLSSVDGSARERLWDLIGRAPKWSGEGLCRHRSAESFSVWMTLSSVHHGAKASGYVGLISDMTERQMAEATIRFQATHDPLTLLANRTAWLTVLNQALADARANEDRVAVLFIDLDGFKAANDRHGHGVGDVLLSTTARRLERCVRRTDLVARFGGDEFIILLRNLNAKHVPLRVAKACVAALKVPFRIDGVDVRITASIGIALYPDHGAVAHTLLAAADAAMYQAKHAGGGRVQVTAPRSPGSKPKKGAVRAKTAPRRQLKASDAAERPATRAPAAPGRSASRRPG